MWNELLKWTAHRYTVTDNEGQCNLSWRRRNGQWKLWRQFKRVHRKTPELHVKHTVDTSSSSTKFIEWGSECIEKRDLSLRSLYNWKNENWCGKRPLRNQKIKQNICKKCFRVKLTWRKNYSVLTINQQRDHRSG